MTDSHSDFSAFALEPGGALVAASHAAPLRLVARISYSSLKSSPNEPPYDIFGLCDVLLASCAADGLRSLRLSSAQLWARDPSALTDMRSAALDETSGTLLLALRAEAAVASGARAGGVMSLLCVADEWREVQRVQTE